MADDVSKHGMWSSRLLFVLAAAGSAVGLGNIWKFPVHHGRERRRCIRRRVPRLHRPDRHPGDDGGSDARPRRPTKPHQHHAHAHAAGGRRRLVAGDRLDGRGGRLLDPLLLRGDRGLGHLLHLPPGARRVRGCRWRTGQRRLQRLPRRTVGSIAVAYGVHGGDGVHRRARRGRRARSGRALADAAACSYC